MGREGGVRSDTQKAVHTQGGAYARQCTHKAVCRHRTSHVIEGATRKVPHTTGGAHTTRNTPKTGCGKRRSHIFSGATGKAVHTEGGAHTRWFVAIAEVMLFNGPQSRRCEHKAEHKKVGLLPPLESCYLTGHRQGGAYIRRCTHKVVRKSHVI